MSMIRNTSKTHNMIKSRGNINEDVVLVFDFETNGLPADSWADFHPESGFEQWDDGNLKKRDGNPIPREAANPDNWPNSVQFCYIIYNNNNERVTISSKTIENENISNNLLEYYALIDALEYIIYNNINNIIIKSNSLVVIKQLLGKYKIKNDIFRHLHDEVKKMLGKLQKCKLQHVIDNSNREAITLAENNYSQSCKLPMLFHRRSDSKT